MGRSLGCLRIIPCAGGFDYSETKSSTARKRLIFKKRPSCGRCGSKPVILNALSPTHMENPESDTLRTGNERECVDSEKGAAVHWDEKKLYPVAEDLYVTETVTVSTPRKQPAAVDSNLNHSVTVSNNMKLSAIADSDATDSKTEGSKTVFILDESVSVVVVIQSAIRGYLARKRLIEHKSAVKLQSAVRGRLVRCRAVGALRCVQAIAKMQVLIRSRYGCLTLEEQGNESNEKGICTPKGRKHPEIKPEITYSSMDELLKNRFAQQLLDSSLKSKPIKIKCDPLGRDSSWVWLERWMSLASPGSVNEHVEGIKTGHEQKIIEKEHEEKIIEMELDKKISTDDYLFHDENEIFSGADNLKSSTSVECSKLTAVEANLIRIEISKTDEDFVPLSLMENAKTEELIPQSTKFDLNIEAATSSGDDIIFNHVEQSHRDYSSFQIGESECGAGLSVTSSPDSPDRSEIMPMGVESVKIQSRDAESHMTEEPSIVKVDIKTESGLEEKYKTDAVNGKSTENITDIEVSHQVSPEALSRSQAAFTESQGTPSGSGQISVSKNSRNGTTKKFGSIKKRSTILPAAKRSSIISTSNSSKKTSAELLPKDKKSFKRRACLGSPKPEIADPEQIRYINASSSSLPRYMQPTESARAKANNPGHSPGQSPNVEHKYAFLKKRQSLSRAKDKPESQRVQRTSSPAQCRSKSNGTSPLNKTG